VSALDGESRHALFTPKPNTGREIPAESRTSLRVPYLAHLERIADGPRGLATAVGYKPETAYVEETLAVNVHCRDDSGVVRVRVAIDETRLAALEKHAVVETVLPGPNAKPGATPTELRAEVQVPVLVHGEVEGEWPVPRGRVLVIGLGVHEMKSADGTRVLTERVAVIDPDDPPAPAAVTRHKTRIIGPPTIDHGARRVALTPQGAAAARSDTPAPAPIAEAGRWSRRAPEVIALRASTPPPVAVAPSPAPLPGQPVVIQAGHQGTTIIIVPGSGSPQVLTPPHDVLAMAMPAPPVAAMPLPAMPVPAPPAVAAPMMTAPVMPALPSRVLPTPLNAHGEVVPLPPLPEAESDVPVDTSGDPLASPQTFRPRGSDDGEDHESKPSEEAADLDVAAQPEGHFSIALGAAPYASSCCPESSCPEPRYVLGVKPADGWRSAAERDRQVERTAMKEPRGKLGLSLSASAPFPTAVVQDETTRVTVPLGPFRMQIELNNERPGVDPMTPVNDQP
jgi:hypothetical protein